MENFQRQKIPTDRLPLQLLAKWPARTLEEGFVPLPKKLLRCMPRLFPGATAANDLAALLAVIDFKRNPVSRLPSRAFLAFVAGLSEQEFNEALKRLEDRRLVSVEEDHIGVDVSIWGLLQAIEAETKVT